MSLTDKLSNDKIVQDVVAIAHVLYPENNIEELRNIIWMHWFYGTIDVIYREDELVACVRWNISPNGDVCDVLDWYVKDKEKGARIMKHLITRNWHRFPTVKYLRFFRQFKYKNREPKIYTLKQILHLNKEK